MIDQVHVDYDQVNADETTVDQSVIYGVFNLL